MVLRARQRRQRAALGKTPKPEPKFNPFVFLPPAMCDMTATSLMYLGLSWTYASVFQMLRGSIIIFVGILSVVFLKRKLHRHHWAGMFIVLIGLGLVGLASVLAPKDDESAPHPLLGDAIVLAAQLVAAVQMVVEEYLLSKHRVPALAAVGWEGVFGFSVLSLLLIPMYYLPGDAEGGRLENAVDAWIQLKNSKVIMLALAGNVLSIAGFNYAGVSITRRVSATSRMVLDSVRTVVIWGFSLLVGWEKPSGTSLPIQLAGFVFLILGTFVYYGILEIPWCPVPPKADEEEPLVQKPEETTPRLHMPDTPASAPGLPPPGPYGTPEFQYQRIHAADSAYVG